MLEKQAVFIPVTVLFFKIEEGGAFKARNVPPS